LGSRGIGDVWEVDRPLEGGGESSESIPSQKDQVELLSSTSFKALLGHINQQNSYRGGQLVGEILTRRQCWGMRAQKAVLVKARVKKKYVSWDSLERNGFGSAAMGVRRTAHKGRV